VELVGAKVGLPALCADEAIFNEYRLRTRKFIAGEEVFGVRISARAKVLKDKGDRLEVQVLEGWGNRGWKDRVGWISSNQVRLVPTVEEASRDVVEGLTLDKRRQIYAELDRIGMLAGFEAEHVVGGFGSGFEALAHKPEKEGQARLAAKYQIDGAHLDRIDEEGTEKRWPMPEVANPYQE
jgi:hypothetical protein